MVWFLRHQGSQELNKAKLSKPAKLSKFQKPSAQKKSEGKGIKSKPSAKKKQHECGGPCLSPPSQEVS